MCIRDRYSPVPFWGTGLKTVQKSLPAMKAKVFKGYFTAKLKILGECDMCMRSPHLSSFSDRARSEDG